jgi:hypothetical protein
MNRPNPYINTLYLAVHLLLNLVVVALVIKTIDFFIPIGHYFNAYYINLHAFFPPSTLKKNIFGVFIIGLAVLYYQKRKAKNAHVQYKFNMPSLPSLREVEDYLRSKF